MDEGGGEWKGKERKRGERNGGGEEGEEEGKWREGREFPNFRKTV